MSISSMGSTRVTHRVKTTSHNKIHNINQSCRKGSLSDLSVNLLKKQAFPKATFYYQPHYPLYMTVSDGVFLDTILQNAYLQHTAAPSTAPLGTLRCVQTVENSTGRGKQLIVQYCDLTQMEFSQLWNKTMTDDLLATNVDVATTSDLSTDQENPSSIWFRYKELFLEKYESNYTFTNTSNVEVQIELITWQPKTGIWESLNYPQNTAEIGNNSPLGCCNQDILNSPPNSWAYANNTSPTNVPSAFTDTILHPSDIRLEGIKLRKLYSLLNRKVITLAPMETINYNIAIPSQILSNWTLQQDYVVNTATALTDRKAGIAFRPFSRFLTVRAYAKATINSELVATGINSGASTFADFSLSVTCSKYFAVRRLPAKQRDVYISTPVQCLNYNGKVLNSVQLHDTVAASNQKLYDDEFNEEPASNV